MGKPPHQPDDSIVRLVDELLARARSRRASDVHFDPAAEGLRVRCRVDGLLVDADRLPASISGNVIARLKVLAGLLTYRSDIPQEGSFALPGAKGQAGGDVRVATFPTVRGERAVVRLLVAEEAERERTLPHLGFATPMAEALAAAVEQPGGLVLVTGPAGSGKSTTLYALARHILARTPGRSVVSLEDPVEQRVAGLAQIQIQPHGDLDYVRAMRSLLRQDVEALLVGEIRDAHTAHVVIEAALTGHLLMSTLHSGHPAEALVRLLEMGIPAYEIVSAVTLVATQRLVRLLCRACEGRGCEACGATGYSGRTAVGQFVSLDDRLRAAVMRQAPLAELRRLVAAQSVDLAEDGRRLLDAGRTTAAELGRVLGAPPAP